MIRENIGIAVDGGGIRGAIVARGLIELEEIPDVKHLVDSPCLKVVAGGVHCGRWVILNPPVAPLCCE
jgi:hypothetical protein